MTDFKEGSCMTKEEFRELASKQRIYLDGATGSNLMKAGMPSGVCPEKWILEHREVMLALQKEYAAAGTDILYSPTFSANRVKLAEYHLEDKMEEMIKALVGISREAASGFGRRILVAGDLTMTGRQLRPLGTMEFEELIDIYKEQISFMVKAGVDLLVVETMMSLQETRAALIAAGEVCRLPVLATMTFEKDGRTLFGTDGVTAAVCLEALGADAVGANCSTGPADMEELIRSMAEAVRIPIIAKPNAGLPYADTFGNTCYDMSAEVFAEEMKLLANAGASILGGCCGTTPEYIKKMRAATADLPRRETGQKASLCYLTSERMTVSFAPGQGFLVIGERINPTGKKALQASLKEGDLDMVRRFAQEQEEKGARILDINMGMSGIDEKEMMLQAIEAVSEVSSLPLSLDSSHVEVLEAALRHYPGRALVNSVSLEAEKFEKLLPLAAKYGAMFILLPLSDTGLPQNLAEKQAIIQKIWERAAELGFRREDIIVDGLVSTVGANRNAALETLETIRNCREQGFATVCGLSNISFGMPERSFVNTAFLTMAIQAGLTMAIANPSQELLMGCGLAADLLLAKEGADVRYIEFAAQTAKRHEEQEAARKQVLQDREVLRTQSAAAEQTAGQTKVSSAEPLRADDAVIQEEGGLSPIRQELYDAVLKGNRNGIAAVVQRALEAGEDPSVLLNQVLLPAINAVGDYFDKGKYFLPQLIGSAEAMKNAIEVLEPLLLQDTQTDHMPVVVIATVEGDIHDIGKNLVVLMLKNYGFRVIDLGKDVPARQIIDAAKEHKAQIIGLSALMTTTMQKMREVVDLARKEGVDAKIMIGGAVITQDYADEIGADGYSKDAADAVKVAKRLAGEP